MSVYFTHRVRCPTNTKPQYVDVLWHPVYSLLAVVSCDSANPESNGMVFFCHDEGEVITDMCIGRDGVVEGICWHPDKKILAIGWSTGEITICNISESECYKQMYHQSAVGILQWSATGSHLITADHSGLILLWQVESKGQLYHTPLHQTKVAGQITHCVMLSSDSKPSIRAKSSNFIVSILATKSGQLYMFKGTGQCVEVEHLNASLSHLVYSPETSFLAALTKTMSLIILSTQNNSVHKYSEAKISGEGAVSSMIWTLPGILATCSEEPAVRFWDTIENDNYSLELKDYGFNTTDQCSAEIVNTISYDNITGLLSAGTSNGRSLIWSRNSDSNQWQLITCITSNKPINKLSWGSSKHLLAACHRNEVEVLKEHVVSSHYNLNISAVQTTVNSLVLQCHTSGATINLSTDIMINGVVVSRDHVAVWDGRTVSIYSITFAKEHFNLTGTFVSGASSVAIYEHNVYTVEEGQLCVRSVVGVLKHKIPLGISPDGVVTLRLTGHHLVLAVVDGTVKMFDLNRREPKQVFSKPVSQHINDFLNILSSEANSNASRVSFIATKSTNKSILAIMDHEKDVIQILDFSQNGGDGSLTLPDNLPETVQKEQLRLMSQLHRFDVVRSYWDSSDPRLLVAEVRRDITRKLSTKKDLSNDWNTAIVTLFVTQDLCYLIQDVCPIKPEHHCVIGCAAPSAYYMRKNLTTPVSVDSGVEPKIPLPVERSPLRDFLGLENCDEATVKAILSFSYHSTMGNMDEAFKDVRTVKSKGVWETLAMMSVKSRRLDVALICLGNMGNARAAKAVREAKIIPEEDAQLAILAVHLGMLDTAEDLYKSSGRHDLLNQFYQASGRWQKAIEVAEVSDRLHLKNTFFNLARYSESIGEIKSAIKSYERSDTHRFEVVRMLVNEPDELLEYTAKSQDKEIQHYWAEHLECTGELDSAIEHYRTCGDIRSVARLLIFSGNTDEAVRVVEETGDRAAAYHIAKVFAQSEEWQRVKKSIELYKMAQCYSHAISVAQEFGMEMELMNIALISTREDKIEAAKYFETKSDSKENAIILYHRAGELSKALELCFQYRYYDILQQIAEELTEGTNPETVRKVAEYFIQQEQFEKAVQILLRSQKMSEALEMCLTHHVHITEELAERLTPPKPENETPEQLEERMSRLNTLANGLVSQGSYHIAAIKYTQSGNRIKAMKALLKSGDTQRVVFFANVSRQKEIYIMAANYLQSLDWRGNPDIMKNIIGFYTKGRALEMLSNFYDTCAKVEIEEYQNYERAQGALNEAITVLEKCKSKEPSAIEEKKRFLQQRLTLIKKFADIRNLYPDDPEQSIQHCQALLDEPHLDVSVRTGDVFAMLVNHYCLHGNHQQAYAYIEEMMKRILGVNLGFYITRETLDAITKALGTVSLGTAAATGEDNGGESDESIEEVVD